jgi:hypothetical protein
VLNLISLINNKEISIE